MNVNIQPFCLLLILPQGFGDPSGDHWLGNQHVFELTHQQAYVLRIELQDWDNGTAYVQYNTFYVASEKLQYRFGGCTIMAGGPSLGERMTPKEGGRSGRTFCLYAI